jgi:ABC-2 type transport system permease protein
MVPSSAWRWGWVRIESGPVGAVAFLLLGCAWSLAFAGLVRHRAEDRQPGRGELGFLLFFHSCSDLQLRPRSQLTGWLGDVAGWNPVTYVLEGLRSLVTQGWQPAALGSPARVAVVAVSACRYAWRPCADAPSRLTGDS